MASLFEHLQAKYPKAKRQTLRRMVADGRVTINGQPARSLKAQVADQRQVKVADRPVRSRVSIEPLVAVYEDEDILVVNKPPGLLSSTVARERRPTALAIARRYVADRQPRARVGLIHRLDRDASGLLVFSKNHAAYAGLKKQFAEHTVRRVYMAVVHGTPKPAAGRIESRLVELPDGSVRNTRARGKGEQAVTDYKLLTSAGGRSLVQVTLHTGRKHQIRSHLSSRGWPVVGDRVYGKEGDRGRLMLCATMLGLAHPRTGRKMTFEVEMPFVMREA